MSHKLFVIDHKPKLDEEERSRVAYLSDKLPLAESLGLKAQVAAIKDDIATVERGRLITTPPLTDAELIIWRAWLPTAYTDIADDERHQLANYRFDRIPQPVLKMWQEHKGSGLFERFEIWTPENDQPDPILVGVNGNARHLLARWGESDANLVSFDDIKRELKRRWYKNENIGGESWREHWSRTEERQMVVNLVAMASFVASAIVIILLVAFGVADSEGDLLAATVLMAASAIGVTTYMHCWLTRRCLATSKLMQAIVKDDAQKRQPLPAPA